MAQNQNKAKADQGYPTGIGVRNSLFVLAGCNLLGLLFTFLVPESKGKSLEEMSRENEKDDQIADATTCSGTARLVCIDPLVFMQLSTLKINLTFNFVMFYCAV